jgi:hypothetical protein
MPIPAFERDGLLPDGIHGATGKEFVERFCVGDVRKHFTKAITDLFDFANERGALQVLVGGSFVSRTEQPRDLDCVIVFAEENQIPDRTERLVIEGASFDIFFCAATQPKLVAAFVHLFSRTRAERKVGVIVVELVSESGHALWRTIQEPDEDTIEIVKRVYFHRHIVDRNNSKKALITVHGIRPVADWNAEVAHIASSNGWIFAPYHYG